MLRRGDGQRAGVHVSWLTSLIAAAVLTAAGLIFVCAPAKAAHIYTLSGQFGQFGSEAGQLNGPEGLAVNGSTHDVYVADRHNQRVAQFTADGTFVRTWGWGVTDGQPKFEICEPPAACQAGQEGSEPAQFSFPLGVAVDNSPSALDPSKGDVYVADGNPRVEKFDSSGHYLATITEGTAGPFEGLVRGVAVSASGDLWVYTEASEAGTVSEFGPTGNALISWTTGLGLGFGIGVDAGEHVYVSTSTGSVEKFTSAGANLGTLDETNANASAIGTDLGTNAIFVDERSFIAKYDASATLPATPIAEFGSGTLSSSRAVAVDATTGEVFAAQFAETGPNINAFRLVLVPDVTTGAASGVTGQSADVAGAVNPDGVAASCTVEYGTTTSYGQRVPCDPAQAGNGNAPVAVTATLLGLQEGTEYHYRVDASNANGTNTGEDRTFTTTSPPLIESASATPLTPAEARLDAKIDPMGFNTTYWFELGPTAAYGTRVPVPPGTLALASGSQTVTSPVTGLSSDTTYHFRVVAESSEGRTTGGDHTFVSPSGAGTVLPDARSYEMVTPSYKAGVPVTGAPATITNDGTKLLGLSLGGFAGVENDEVGTNGEFGAWYAFNRVEGSGWSAAPATPAAKDLPHAVPQVTGPDTSIWSSATVPGGGGHGEEHLILRSADGSLRDIGPVWPPAVGAHRSLTTYVVEAATGDGSHVVYSIEYGPFLWPFDSTVPARPSLYAYDGPQAAPSLVGVSGARGSSSLISQCGTVLGDAWEANGSVLNALSNDGASIVFTAVAGSEHASPYAHTTCADGEGHTGAAPAANELYARVAGSSTTWVSEPACSRVSPACHNVSTDTYTTAAQSEAAAVRFAGASASGSKVFFSTTQQLTNGDTDATPDLYEYDFSAPAGQRLVQVSAGGMGDPTPGSSADVQGVAGVSEDGERVYFVARGVLTDEPNSTGDRAQPGADNLYLYAPDATHPGQHSTSFVARLCSGPQTSGTVADAQCPTTLNADEATLTDNHNDLGLWRPSEKPQINLTPDGRFAVFASYGDLTADDTSTARQVFEYDGQTGTLTRISIGERGFNDGGNAGLGDARIVSSYHTAHGFTDSTSRRVGSRMRTMSDDGSYVFFQSPAGLVPHALNDVPIDASGDFAQNVYEYHAGHVYLISDGNDTASQITKEGHQSAVTLIGTTPTGRDVFFTTADRLVAQDTDTQIDIYDARVDGGFPPPPVESACRDEGCQGVSSTPLFTAPPASAGFFGPGNATPPMIKPLTRAQQLAKALRACRAKKVKRKRLQCKARARRRYGAKSKGARAKRHRGRRG